MGDFHSIPCRLQTKEGDGATGHELAYTFAYLAVHGTLWRYLTAGAVPSVEVIFTVLASLVI
jgi:hypothetical protein